MSANNFSLFVSSWSGDVTRCQKLYESIQKFNSDKIPFYIILSKNDIPIFKNILGSQDINYVEEEQINPYKNAMDGWRLQQVNKMEFWRLNITKNYFALDSDCLFIKPFYEDDFIAYDDIPYTTVFEDNMYQLTLQHYDNWKDDHNREFIDLIHKSWQRDIRKVIPTKYKKALHFGPCPITYNSKVWESFYTEFVEPNNLKTHDLIRYVSADYGWYGEYLMFSKKIDIVPTESQFLVMHNKKQYDWFFKNISIEEIKRVYLGIIINSSFYAGEENENRLNLEGRKWELSKSLSPKIFGGWYEQVLQK
jgi:hypothetical protein